MARTAKNIYIIASKLCAQYHHNAWLQCCSDVYQVFRKNSTSLLTPSNLRRGVEGGGEGEGGEGRGGRRGAGEMRMSHSVHVCVPS